MTETVMVPINCVETLFVIGHAALYDRLESGNFVLQ